VASQGVSRYRWSRAYGLRIVGAVVVVLAVAWVIAALASFATWSVALLVVAAAATLGCVFRLLVVPPLLLEVSNEGYHVHHIRGGGVQVARWSEVAAVEGGSGARGAVMSITLSNGRVTVVPTALLGDQSVLAEREVHDRLNAAFGYRRLGGR
jgi:hypothetical protein